MRKIKKNITKFSALFIKQHMPLRFDMQIKRKSCPVNELTISLCVKGNNKWFSDDFSPCPPRGRSRSGFLICFEVSIKSGVPLWHRLTPPIGCNGGNEISFSNLIKPRNNVGQIINIYMRPGARAESEPRPGGGGGRGRRFFLFISCSDLFSASRFMNVWWRFRWGVFRWRQTKGGGWGWGLKEQKVASLRF